MPAVVVSSAAIRVKSRRYCWDSAMIFRSLPLSTCLWPATTMSGSSAAAGTDPGHAWTIAAGQLGGQPGYAALIDGYLSTWHRDHPEAGCGVAGVAADAARA